MSQLDITKELTDQEIQEKIDNLIIQQGKETYLSLGEKESLSREVFNSLRRLDILQELIEDPGISEIMVNGTENIFIEKRGEIFQWHKKFDSYKKLEDMIQQVVSKSNRRINDANPIADARLQNGERVNIVLYPIALNGPIITIRKFPKKVITMKELIHVHTLTQEVAEFLKYLVVQGYNIFISGGTSSGKTTFLNALSEFIPLNERIITIEDSAELQIVNHPNLVRLEARTASIEGNYEITIRDLIRTSLRMRPDRLIVGEVRGGEALDMLQAMNTGHDGSLSTGHSNSTKDMISRLETMVLMGTEIPLEAVKRQISAGIDIILHLERMKDGSRKVVEISEIGEVREGEVQLFQLFTRENKKAELRRCKDLKRKR
ncbi:CpaF family protein [Anaerosacchariphilus polymeriproducens]|uniref:CpaF family protein n=1 Tax=Anaerosacchariphilus polymeriproducens TaxID=1812858 RepID=UPI001F1DFF46|nr:CpaF family protein [Anaerosacchariphilus polymeriproducens]